MHQATPSIRRSAAVPRVVDGVRAPAGGVRERPAAPGAVPRLAGLAYGGDYNPEQWPEEVWREDVALMREAGVNLVTVGVFSWALLEPAPGRFDFGWLDRVLDLLDGAGILVDLATPTAVPPAWFRRLHPEAHLVDADGRVLGGGARQSFCPSSAAYGQAAERIAGELARRYAGHPALALWHLHNEYGGVNAHCYCPASAEAFRGWLRDRYGDLAALNEAWGTTFWGQRYGDWAEVDAPRAAPTAVNPSQQLDFRRFCSDAHLANFRRERGAVRRWSPDVPITTNFMITNCKDMDYWAWAAEVDVISNDHYLQAERPDNHIELAMAADLTRAVAGGRPWLLMEHSPGAVNWQPRNLAKRPGEMARNSLAHVARGADGAMFFQWRAARFGAEKFHSAMVPQGGPDTPLFRDVAALGADVGRLAELRGTQVAAQAALIWDWQSWWALELEWRPSVDLRYLERVSAYYERLWRAGITCDFAHPEGDLDRYPLVLVPSLYLTTPAAAENLRRYVAGGGTLLVSYFSGIVDATDTVHPGPYPGALRDLLGVAVEEFLPLPRDASVELTGPGGPLVADVWAEQVTLRGAEAVLRYADGPAGGPAAGGPAVTRHAPAALDPPAAGRGVAWYVSTRLDGPALDAVLRRVYRDAGLAPRPSAAHGLEVVRRVRPGGASYQVAVNHGDHDGELPARGVELLTGAACDGVLLVPAGAVRVVREHP